MSVRGEPANATRPSPMPRVGDVVDVIVDGTDTIPGAVVLAVATYPDGRVLVATTDGEGDARAYRTSVYEADMRRTTLRLTGWHARCVTLDRDIGWRPDGGGLVGAARYLARFRDAEREAWDRAREAARP